MTTTVQGTQYELLTFLVFFKRYRYTPDHCRAENVHPTKLLSNAHAYELGTIRLMVIVE